MTVRELFEQANAERIANALADVLLDDVIMCHFRKQEELVWELLNAIKEICTVKFAGDYGEELKVVKILDYTEDEDKEKFEVLLKQPNDGEYLGIIMMPWRKLVDLQIADLSLAKYDRDEIALAILHDMTFFGFSEAGKDARLKEEEKILEECFAATSASDAKFYTLEEVCEHLGFDMLEETEEREYRSRKLRERIIKNNRVYEEFGFVPIPVD